MAYEYTVMVETNMLDSRIAATADPNDISRAQGEGVNALLQKAVSNAEALDGGGWEVFTFDQLLLGDQDVRQPVRLVTTFLLRRELSQTE